MGLFYEVLMDAWFPTLPFESPFHALGPELWDEVPAAKLTGLRLRWSGAETLDKLLPDGVAAPATDALVRAFGAFEALPGRLHGPLAQRYIGYQFRVFNPNLGDGRGFLLGQVRGRDGVLWDLGTKGSGTTPWSRGGDGRLTLKGGVREILAAEFLHAMGVKTSRPLTLVEHDDRLWRGDEPSPTRSSVLVRVGEGHVRFGTFERLFYLNRDPEVRQRLIGALVDHVVEVYYPHLRPLTGPERTLALYAEVIERTARMVAGWVKAGFCHGVLNTDNMNITGDSFDYGPWAFLERYDPEFTAAYFDHQGLYAFERQADACGWNLGMLMRPLGVLAPEEALRERLLQFGPSFGAALRRALLPRLGFEDRGEDVDHALFEALFGVLREQGPDYHGLFRALGERLECRGIEEGGPELPPSLWAKAGEGKSPSVRAFRAAWLARWERGCARGERLEEVVERCRVNNPVVVPWRREVERVWEAIDQGDDWGPFDTWVRRLSAPFAPPRPA